MSWKWEKQDVLPWPSYGVKVRNIGFVVHNITGDGYSPSYQDHRGGTSRNTVYLGLEGEAISSPNRYMTLTQAQDACRKAYRRLFQ